MDDRIVTAAEVVDRTPNWDKWRLIPRLEPWQCAALWANIDPEKVRTTPNSWMTIFNESKDFQDRLDVVEANQYGELKTKGSSGVDLRLFAAWVRGIGYWPPPAELLAMADEHDPGEPKTPMSAEGKASGKRRAHKRDIAARNHEWQAQIDDLATKDPGKNHSDLCRKLAKVVGAPFQTIRKNTTRRHS